MKPQPGLSFISFTLAVVSIASMIASAGETDLPDAKPVPDMQVIPLPYDQASFQYRGRELTRFHFSPTLTRPFLSPVIGPAGCSYTRMGHPHDPQGHSHHNSIWISHVNVNETDFWADRTGARIVCRQIDRYEDGMKQASLLCTNAWQNAQSETLMLERRRIEVVPLEVGQWMMTIDLQLEAPGKTPVKLGETPFGIIGVRVAKTIGVNDGGGRILNSKGRINEKQIFRKPARWVDYSGPITAQQTGGITLMDHPGNPGHPTPFHVRNDGWMGPCLTLNEPLTIEPGKPLRLRYALWVHEGVPSRNDVEKLYRPFAESKPPNMQPKRPH